MKTEHPAYWRGLLFRLAAPGVFLVCMGVAAAFHAPQAVYLVGLFAAFGVLFLGKQRSRNERRDAGLTPTLPLVRMLRDGGALIILIIPLVMLLMFLASKR